MQGQLINMLMSQLKSRNPQMFQMLEQARKNQGNPQEMLNSVIGKYSPEQMKNFRQFANNFGISNEQLDNFGIKVK